MARCIVVRKVAGIAATPHPRSFLALMAKNEDSYRPKPATSIKDLTLRKAFPPPPKE